MDGRTPPFFLLCAMADLREKAGAQQFKRVTCQRGRDAF